MAVLRLIIVFLALLAAYNGIPSRNYQVERRFMESVGQGDCVPLFESEEIEIHHIPRLDDATLRELGVNTIGGRMRLRDAARNYQGDSQEAGQGAGVEQEAGQEAGAGQEGGQSAGAVQEEDQDAGAGQEAGQGAGAGQEESQGAVAGQEGGQGAGDGQEGGQGAVAGQEGGQDAGAGQEEGQGAGDGQEAGQVAGAEQEADQDAGLEDVEDDVIFSKYTSLSGKVYHYFYVNGFKYGRNKVKPLGKSYWRCLAEGCHAGLRADYSSRENSNYEEPRLDLTSIPPASAHCLRDGTLHPVQVGLRMVCEARHRMRRLIGQDPLRPVAEVYEEINGQIKAELEGADREEYVLLMPSLKIMERSLYRWRREHMPATPESQQGIDVDLRFAMDRDGNSIVVGDYSYPMTENGRILVLSGQKILDWLGGRHREGLQTVSRIGVDATFKVCPGNYQQLLIVHGWIGETFWSPLLYVLMPWRDRQAYDQVYEMVDDALASVGFEWGDNISVMMDFEIAEREAWKERHPGHRVEGCMFHMCQNMWKYISRHGQSTLYNENSIRGKAFRGFCWMCFSLPLCPPTRIEEAFLLLEDEIPSFATPALEAFATEFLAYIRRTYMGGQYGTEAEGYDWNFYNQIDETHQQLTNNPSEGANHRLAVRCKTAHPGIYPFFGVIVKEQENTFDKIEQFENGNLQQNISPKTRALQKSRLKLKIMEQERMITLRKFMRSQGVLNMKIKDKKRTRVPAPPAGAEAEEQVVDRAVRGALVSVTDLTVNQDGARRQARGGRRAGGVRGRGAAPTHRVCPGCGATYRKTYLARHQRDHCPGVVMEEEEHEAEEDSGDDENTIPNEEDDAGYNIDEVLAEVNDLDQTLLGERRRTGLFRRGEEVEEDEAQNLQQRLEQQRHQQERPRPDSDTGSSGSRPRTVVPQAHQGPSQGRRQFHAPPRHVNRYNSDSELIDDDGEVILPAPASPSSPASSPHHLVLGPQLHRREERSIHSLAGTETFEDVFGDLSQLTIIPTNNEATGASTSRHTPVPRARVVSLTTPEGGRIADVSSAQLRSVVTRLAGRGITPVEASTPLDTELELPQVPDVSAVEPRQRLGPGTTPAENNTTSEECQDTLPTPPRVFYSRHARTNCPVCQKDISSSYIDRHLRNMHRKQ